MIFYSSNPGYVGPNVAMLSLKINRLEICITPKTATACWWTLGRLLKALFRLLLLLSVDDLLKSD